MKNTGSNLTTPIGLVILLILIFAAAYVKIPALEIFLIVILLLCLISWVWTVFALRKINFSMKEKVIYSFPDKDFTINAEVYNKKFLPLIWLKLQLSGRNMHIIDSSSSAKTITWIMPWQQLAWTWKIKALTRGVCTLNKYGMQSGDGFGLSEKNKSFDYVPALKVIVFPKTFPVDISYIRKNVRELENSPSGLYSDRTLLKFTRPYTGYENSKNINWRSLARGNEPEVNIYEQQTMHRICLIPDLESFTYEEITDEDGKRKIIHHLRRDEFEYALSMIASILKTLDRGSITPSLIIPAYRDHEADIVSGNQEVTDIELLTALAEIDYDYGSAEISLSVLEDNLHLLGQIFVFSYSKDTIKLRLPDEISCRYILISGMEEISSDQKYVSAAIIDHIHAADSDDLIDSDDHTSN